MEHVDNRIEAFLEWFIKEKLEKLSDEEFNLAIMTLIKQKCQADVGTSLLAVRGAHPSLSLSHTHTSPHNRLP